MVVNPGNHELWRKCELLEYEIFREEGYIEPNRHRRLVFYDGYEPAEMICVHSREREVVGTWRLVFSREKKMNPGLFPTIDNPETLRIFPHKMKQSMAMDPRKCCDMSAAAILPEYKKTGQVSKMLFRGVFLRMWEKGSRYGFGALDERWFHRIRKRGLEIEAIGPGNMYLGSFTIPIVIDTHKVPKGMAKLIIAGCRFKGLLRAGR